MKREMMKKGVLRIEFIEFCKFEFLGFGLRHIMSDLKHNWT